MSDRSEASVATVLLADPAATPVEHPEPAEHAAVDLSDDELTALALAADPTEAVDEDAVPYWDVIRPGVANLLPDWYMPMPMGAARVRRGWRRRLAIVLIIAFVLINAWGLCSTYGLVVAA